MALVAAAASPWLCVALDESLPGFSRLVTLKLPDFFTFFELLDAVQRKRLFERVEAALIAASNITALFTALSRETRSRAFAAALTDPFALVRKAQAIEFAEDVFDSVLAAVEPFLHAEVTAMMRRVGDLAVSDDLLPLLVPGLIIVMSGGQWARLQGLTRDSVAAVLARSGLEKVREICDEFANREELQRVVGRLYLAQMIGKLDLSATLFARLEPQMQARILARSCVPVRSIIAPLVRDSS